MKITIILKADISTLPPVQTLVNYLIQSDYDITLITGSPLPNDFEDKIKIIRLTKSYGKLKTFTKFNMLVKENYPTEGIVWIASGDTAISLLDILTKRKGFILQLHELYDKFYFRTKLLKAISRFAKKIVVPDLARAGYFLDKFELQSLPDVLVNIPFKNSINNINDTLLPSDVLTKINDLKNKKIILYQGHLSSDRNLELFAKAVDSLNDEYILLLVGKDHGVVEQILNNYNCVMHIPWVTPPYHLLITKLAYIGILKYDYSSLNNIFCAPNKIYEYSLFSKPMLANKSPTTIRDIHYSKAGICVDESDYMFVVDAIREIEDSYESYSYFSSLIYLENNYLLNLEIILEK